MGRARSFSASGKWVGALSLEDGKRRTVYGRTQREVRARLREVRVEVEDGLCANAARMTVSTYLSTWVSVTLPAKTKSGALKEQTLDSYRSIVELHISPPLGHHRLRNLKPSDLRAWLAELQDKSQTPAARGASRFGPPAAATSAARCTRASRYRSCPLALSPTRTRSCAPHCLTPSTIRSSRATSRRWFIRRLAEAERFSR